MKKHNEDLRKSIIHSNSQPNTTPPERNPITDIKLLQAENDRLEGDVQKLLDEAKGFYDRADKVAGENVRLKNLLREILNNYTTIVDATGGCIGYDCEFDEDWLWKVENALEEKS